MQGKYSPNIPKSSKTMSHNDFIFTAKYIEPEMMWLAKGEESTFKNYDAEGFDSYGYSAYDKEGNYMGIGAGIDRNGFTEDDYMYMDEDEFLQYVTGNINDAN